jgi:hypothetical protein
MRLRLLWLTPESDHVNEVIVGLRDELQMLKNTFLTYQRSIPKLQEAEREVEWSILETGRVPTSLPYRPRPPVRSSRPRHMSLVPSAAIHEPIPPRDVPSAPLAKTPLEEPWKAGGAHIQQEKSLDEENHGLPTTGLYREEHRGLHREVFPLMLDPLRRAPSPIIMDYNESLVPPPSSRVSQRLLTLIPHNPTSSSRTQPKQLGSRTQLDDREGREILQDESSSDMEATKIIRQLMTDWTRAEAPSISKLLEWRYENDTEKGQ